MATSDWIILVVFFLCLVAIVCGLLSTKRMILVPGRVFVPFYAHNKLFIMREFLLK